MYDFLETANFIALLAEEQKRIAQQNTTKNHEKIRSRVTFSKFDSGEQIPVYFYPNFVEFHQEKMQLGIFYGPCYTCYKNSCVYDDKIPI